MQMRNHKDTVQTRAGVRDSLLFSAVRRPVQCEGVERGHRRAAEVAASGAVMPQGLLGDVLGTLGGLARNLPI